MAGHITAKHSSLHESGCQDAGVSCLEPSLVWPNLSAVRAENMRREGYELSVSPPVVVYRSACLLVICEPTVWLSIPFAACSVLLAAPT